MRSTSRLSACPAASFPSVVTAQVCGTRSMSNGISSYASDREADAVERDRALFSDEARKPGGRVDGRMENAVLFPTFDHGRDAVHVACYEMAAERLRWPRARARG